MLLNKMLFLFEADADSIKKGTQEGKKGADDLTDAMKRSDEQAKKTSMNFAKFAKGALGFIGVAAIAHKAMSKSADIHLLNQTSEAIGENVESVDAFSRALQDNGATSEAAIGSLTNLFRSAGEAAREAGGMQAKAFEEMGISLTDANGEMRGSVELMGDLAGVADKLGADRAAAYFQKLGITDQRVVETLIKGRKELDESVKSHKALGGVTKESAEKAGEFDTAMNKLTHGLDRGAIKMTDMLMPAITWVVDKLGVLVQWFNENEKFITGFFVGVAGAVTYAFLPAMLAAGAATLAAMLPFLLIGAAIAVAATAFALIYDDIMNFIDGNDSLIGQILRDFPVIGEIISTVVDIAKQGFDLLIQGSKDLLNAFTMMGKGIIAVFQWVWDSISSIINMIIGAVGKVADVVGSVGGWFKNKLGFSADVEGNLNDAKTQTGSAASNPANAMTSSAINNQRTNNVESNLTIGQVTVETQATDAAGVSAGLSDSLSAELEKMQANNATPITR